jgi:hypothetical protein
MDNFSNQDVAAEYQALKAANDQLRERSKQWLWETLNDLCAEINRALLARGAADALQIGRQEWQFQLGTATMAGERFGVRYRFRTLTIEVGWPRTAQHGYVSDGGLARARVGLSQNTMIEPQIVADLILKRPEDSDPIWLVIADKKLGPQVTATRLRTYLDVLLAD